MTCQGDEDNEGPLNTRKQIRDTRDTWRQSDKDRHKETEREAEREEVTL